MKEEVKKGRTVLYGSQIFKDDIIKRKYFPLYFRLLNSSGGVVFQAAHATGITFPSHKNMESFYTFKMPDSSKTFRFYEKSVVINDKETYIFQIATEMKRAEKILENFLENIFRALPVILFLSIVCGIYVSRQPRKVIRNITTVAKRMTLQNMKQRLEVPLADDGIRDLTVTINEMMNRLEKSFEHMKQFTSDVSHELRNPLFALKGELEVLLSQKRDVQEYREALYECEERVDFLIKMSNDLFLISCFDENKIQMDFDYLNIDDVIHKVCDLFLPMVEEKNIKLVMNLSNGLTILADKIKLSQVVSNLLDNAIKFTPPNGRIDLSVVRKSNNIELRVKDNGRGIPEDKTDRIFERFYQVDTSRSNQKGTGLGLQICKKIIEAHKGRIKVEKNKGEGVTFVVLIPCNV
jgi:heavy metal sensor kinase